MVSLSSCVCVCSHVYATIPESRVSSELTCVVWLDRMVGAEDRSMGRVSIHGPATPLTRSTVPFPLNFLLLPFSIVEAYIVWVISD